MHSRIRYVQSLIFTSSLSRNPADFDAALRESLRALESSPLRPEQVAAVSVATYSFVFVLFLFCFFYLVDRRHFFLKKFVVLFPFKKYL
jgi:hypothetical protein